MAAFVLTCGWISCVFGSKHETEINGDWPADNFTHTMVSLKEFRSGGLGKDGIPALESPDFVPIKDADVQLDQQEPVIVFQNRITRAYPLSILLWHEIVNDTIDGKPVAVTFCPLCSAAIVFDRRAAGRTLDFGTTGLLRNSDLVMYDRQTQSWWQQFTGECLAGKLAGTKLRVLPSNVVSYAEFRSTYAAGQVLSINTGHKRAYGTNPYRHYDDTANSPFLYAGVIDPRLPPLERVLGLTVGSEPRAYPYSILERYPIITDTIAGVPVVIIATGRMLSVLDHPRIAQSKITLAPRAFAARLETATLAFVYRDGKMIDAQSHSLWNSAGRCIAGPLKGKTLSPITATPSFAFAWLAFHANSTIYPDRKNR